MAKKNFEKKIEELETILNNLEKNDLSLEKSMELFEQGMKLSQNCSQELEKAEFRIKELVKKNNTIETQS